MGGRRLSGGLPGQIAACQANGTKRLKISNLFMENNLSAAKIEVVLKKIPKNKNFTVPIITRAAWPDLGLLGKRNQRVPYHRFSLRLKMSNLFMENKSSAVKNEVVLKKIPKNLNWNSSNNNQGFATESGYRHLQRTTKKMQNYTYTTNSVHFI